MAAPSQTAPGAASRQQRQYFFRLLVMSVRRNDQKQVAHISQYILKLEMHSPFFARILPVVSKRQSPAPSLAIFRIGDNIRRSIAETKACTGA